MNRLFGQALHRKKALSLAVLLLICLTLCAGIATPTLAGAIGGPRSVVMRLQPNDSVTFMIDFEGGQPAKVELKAERGARFKLSVRDPAGVLVNSVAAGYLASIKWMTPSTGTYSITITNWTTPEGEEAFYAQTN